MEGQVHHTHWELDSICPHCGTVNHVKVPTGERVVMVECSRCPHHYQYTHIVQEHTEVTDN